MTPKVKKNWVFTPSQDYSPKGSLQLGQVLEDPWQPASALVPEETIKPPKEIITDDTTKTGVNIHLHDSLNASYALWLKASELPLGGESGGNTDSSSTATFDIKRLESKMFTPSLKYISEVLGSGDVPTKTQWWKARTKVFVVTGVRIAYGTSFDKEETDTSEIHGSLQADGTQSGVPASGGGKFNENESSGIKEVAKTVSPFVFAYRLQQVRYRLVVSHKPFDDGHTVDVESGSVPETGENEYTGYELVKIDEKDFGAGKEFSLLSVNETMEEAFLVRR
jgi:hypothetical protein